MGDGRSGVVVMGVREGSLGGTPKIKCVAV